MTTTLNYSNNTITTSMLKKVVLISGILPVFITGCTGLSGSQPPAPVYNSNHPYNAPPIQKNKQVAAIQKVEEVVQVQTLEEFTPIIEPLEIKIEPIVAPTPITPTINSDIPKVIEVAPSTKHLLMPTPPTETGVPKFEPKPLAEFKPAESSNSQSPAITALVTAAAQSSKSGDTESASAAIERAIRIDPRNAELLYKLAVLRLKQSKPDLAEDLAKKAALLAGKDNTLKKNSWLLIAHAKEMQNDNIGAEQAKNKAAGF
ncbi:hypothetical protein LBMAG43_04870 [Methylococcaceae bacterium]|nr:hypothetical protein LBMAG43_04870 [Methylococcaceae bacterium]